jgi:IPT/TIG domain
MGDYSKAPEDALDEARNLGYSGIHVEQGVPILDRDLNLMHDLLASGMQSMLSRYIGDGIPDVPGEGFAIRSLPDGQNENTFQIVGPGACLVGGREATIAASTDYKNQPHVAALRATDHPSRPQPLTTPPAGGTDRRSDVVYLDVFTIEVDGTADLDNSRDVGMQTSVRLKSVWTVRVAEGTEKPPDPVTGHSHYPLARLLRRPGEARITEVTTADGQAPTQFFDLRKRRLTVASLETRLSRLETILFAPSFTQEAGQVTPMGGKFGAAITLNGKNFKKGTNTVNFGGVPALNVVTESDVKIIAAVPAGLTPDGKPRNVRVSVGNEIGTAVSDVLFVVSPLPAFVPAPNQFSPTSGPSGTIVSLFGFNFMPGPVTVTFNVPGQQQVPAEVQPDSTNTELKVIVPLGITGKAKIRVTLPGRPFSDTESLFEITPN